MKPLSAPRVPGNTDAERMDNALRMFLSVPKEAFLKAEAKEKGPAGKELDHQETALKCRA
jgi:hypothetical protein